MMDYSIVDDGIVYSLPSRAVILVAMNLPSPLSSKKTSEFSKSKCRDTNGAQCNLYLELSPPSNNKLHKVGLLYHLPSISSQFLLCNEHF